MGVPGVTAGPVGTRGWHPLHVGWISQQCHLILVCPCHLLAIHLPFPPELGAALPPQPLPVSSPRLDMSLQDFSGGLLPQGPASAPSDAVF